MKRSSVVVLLLTVVIVTVGCTVKPEDPTFGDLEVNSTPSGARIWLDGEPAYEGTPHTFTELETDRYTLRLIKTGYSDWIEQVEVLENETVIVNAVLDSNPALITISSDPSGASIWIDDLETGEVTPYTISMMAPVYLDLSLRLPGYFQWNLEQGVDPGETLQVNATLTPVPDYEIVYNIGDELWQAGLDNTDPLLLTSNYVSSTRNRIQCSPDGQMVAYYAGNNTNAIIDRNGNQLAIMGYSGSRVDDYSWSNDSNYLTNGSYFDGIYHYDLLTGVKTQIMSSSHRTFDHNPVFSPDDSLIAFVHHENGSAAWIGLLDANGANCHFISPRLPAWDDQHLFLTWISADALLFRICASGIWMATADGSDCQMVVDCRPNLFRVSADRTMYAYSAGSDLYFAEVGDWSPIFLTEEYGTISQMDWSPDNNGLVFRTSSGVYWGTLDGQVQAIPGISGSGGVGILVN